MIFFWFFYGFWCFKNCLRVNFFVLCENVNWKNVLHHLTPENFCGWTSLPGDLRWPWVLDLYYGQRAPALILTNVWVFIQTHRLCLRNSINILLAKLLQHEKSIQITLTWPLTHLTSWSVVSFFIFSGRLLQGYRMAWRRRRQRALILYSYTK